MRYKAIVTKKLENFENNLSSLYSLLSNPNLTREQLDDWYAAAKERLNEIQTLINTEQESF